MTTPSPSPSYKGYRFPAEIISHAVWLYYRFPLSYRDVEELLAERTIVLTYETVRQWCQKFGVSANKRWVNLSGAARPGTVASTCPNRHST
jgi:transposase-like protein